MTSGRVQRQHAAGGEPVSRREAGLPSNPATGSTRPTPASRSIRRSGTGTFRSGRRFSSDQGQVRRVDRYPASLQRSGVRPARPGHRAHRGQRRDVPQRLADAVHVEPAAVEPAALRGRRHGRPEHVRDRELRRRSSTGRTTRRAARARRSGSTSRTRRVAPSYHGVGAIGIGVSDQFKARFATSYVTGAHNFKAGFTILRGDVTGNTINRADDVGGLPISYTFTNGVPTSMTLFASRNSEAHLKHDLSLFAQDQWTMQPADPEPRPALRLAARARRRRSTTRPTRCSRRTARRPSTMCRTGGSQPAHRRRLRPVRQRQDRDQGRHQPLRRRGVDRRRPTLRADGELQHDPQLDGRQRQLLPRLRSQERRAAGSAGLRRRLLRTVQHAERRHVYATSQSVPDPDFIDGWGKRGYNWRATATVEQQLIDRHGAGGDLCPDDLRWLHRDRQPEPHARRLRSLLHHGAGGRRGCRAAASSCAGCGISAINVATSNLVDVRRQLRQQVPVLRLLAERADRALQRVRPSAERRGSRGAEPWLAAGAWGTPFRTRRSRPTAARSTTRSTIASSWTTRSC